MQRRKPKSWQGRNVELISHLFYSGKWERQTENKAAVNFISEANVKESAINSFRYTFAAEAVQPVQGFAHAGFTLLCFSVTGGMKVKTCSFTCIGDPIDVTFSHG